MKGILKIEKTDGQVEEHEVEIVKVQLSGVTDLKLKFNGKTVRFQYETRSYHTDAKEGKLQKGYLITKKIQDCWFKYKK